MKRAFILPMLIILLAISNFAGVNFAINNLSVCVSPSEVQTASSNEILHKNKIEFYYANRVFSYNLAENVKKSDNFYLNYEINKYKRFGEEHERKALLKRMLNLGFDSEIALNYLFPNLSALINSIEKNIKIAPKNASLKLDANSEKVFFITPEIIGQKLDKSALYANIIESYLKNLPLKFNLPLIKLMPEVLRADFLKFTNLRADFSTDFSASSADRKHNIKNALVSLNKVEILPGETFSFNRTVGRRTAENGYRQAKIIVNNEFVDGVGGGVCQVSSTLYNSALLAGLDIVEANKHSKQVGYVKYGFDAMVNFGSSDLKIKNNTSQKITLITNYSGDRARIRVYGEKLNESYKLTNEIVSVTEPKEEVLFDTEQKYTDKVVYDDESFYLKKGYKGMEIKSYRETYVNGELVSKKLLRHDKFTVQNAVKVFGIKKRKDEIFAPMVFDLLVQH